MRLNTVNQNYIMINQTDFNNKEFINKVGNNIYSHIILSTSNYYKKTGLILEEIAIKLYSNTGLNLLKLMSNNITITDIHNAFMYAVIMNIEKMQLILEETLRNIKNNHNIDISAYGNDVLLFVLNNKNYNYLEEENYINSDDNIIYLLDDDYNIKKFEIDSNNKLGINM